MGSLRHPARRIASAPFRVPWASGRRRPGRPSTHYGLRARGLWVAAPATVRVCREQGSVVVVSPASSPLRDRARGGGHALHRAGCASRLLRGGDRGGWSGAARRPREERAEGAGAVRAEPRRRRRGCAGGDRQRARDRARERAACRPGRARESEGGQGHHPGGREDRQDRRAHAREAARGRLLPEVWLPDEQTRILRRRVSDRAQLVRQRTRAKNQVHATLIRNLKRKPPVSDLFGVRGRRWLAEQVLPADEQETVAVCLRQIAFLDAEIALVECALARQVLASREMRRLLTLPGVNFVTAAALIAAIGEIDRFATARHLVSYLGFDPRVRQSGTEPAGRGGSLSRGPARPGTCWSKRPGTACAFFCVSVGA